MTTHPSANPTETNEHPTPAADHPAQPETAAQPAIPPMALTRRPNRRSVLKNRPREFQQQLMEYLEGTASTPRHTLQATVDWLASQGIQTHPSALRDFRDWWELAHQLGAAAADRFDRARREIPDTGLSEDHILRTGQAVFEEQAVLERDAKLFTAMVRLRHRERALELQQLALEMRNDLARDRAEMQQRLAECRERMADLAIWKAETNESEQQRKDTAHKQAKMPKEVENFDNSAVIETLRQAAFAELEEVLASGEVVLPK